jgi:SAM-dependent methyltransferase
MKKIRAINLKIKKLDNKRDALIKRAALLEFQKTYSIKYDIKNLNTGKYWDDIFYNEGDLSQQSSMTKDKIRKIANVIPLKSLRILDLGIGQGFLEEILVKRNVNYKLEGIDISPIAIKRAKKLFNGKFIVGDVLDINKYYKKNGFDYAVALELLEHISPSQLFPFYKKIKNVLKDSGKFILSIPINENLHLMDTNPSAHVRDYSFDIIKTELELNGFKVEKYIYLSAFNKFYKLKKIISKIFKSRWEANSLIIVASKVVK